MVRNISALYTKLEIIGNSSQQSLSLNENALPQIKVQATVIFSILNAYSRRASKDSRLIGTLLGEVKDGIVTVSPFLSLL